MEAVQCCRWHKQSPLDIACTGRWLTSLMRFHTARLDRAVLPKPLVYRRSQAHISDTLCHRRQTDMNRRRSCRTLRLQELQLWSPEHSLSVQSTP